MKRAPNMIRQLVNNIYETYVAVDDVYVMCMVKETRKTCHTRHAHVSYNVIFSSEPLKSFYKIIIAAEIGNTI